MEISGFCLDTSVVICSSPFQAWVGHPYFDIVDNTTDFENKIRRVIARICKRIGNDIIDDRLQPQSKKRKFLIRSLPDLKVRLV